MRAFVLSLYDLGRVPLEARAVADRIGARLLQPGIDELSCIQGAEVVVLMIGMHTAARLAQEVLPEIRAIAPHARVATTGLYAELVDLDVDASFGPESVAAFERWIGIESPAKTVGPDPTDGARGSATTAARQSATTAAPLDLSAAARFLAADGTAHLSGAVATSRGCLHRCRHCPVPVAYDGRIHLHAATDVLAQIDEQVVAGAAHMSFSDPDFLNAPGHAGRIVAAMRERHPALTWDATVKVEHILRHRDEWPRFAAIGCSFIISAFESVDDATLLELDKGHTVADLGAAVKVLRAAGIEVRPSWMPFTPWTRVEHIVDLFSFVAAHDLVGSVDPIQFAIRLLVPKGSLLAARLTESGHITTYDQRSLTYPWTAHDSHLDELAADLAVLAEKALAGNEPVETTFRAMRSLAHDVAGLPHPPPTPTPVTRPRLSESWFCCAEPTTSQLATVRDPSNSTDLCRPS